MLGQLQEQASKQETMGCTFTVLAQTSSLYVCFHTVYIQTRAVLVTFANDGLKMQCQHECKLLLT